MQAKTLYVQDGEVRVVTERWTAETEKRGTTISSSAWESTTGSLTSQTLSGAVTTVKLTGALSGDITNTVTLANGEVLKRWRSVDQQ